MQEIILNKIGLLTGITFFGVSLLSIVGAIIWFTLKTAFNRTISKINIEKIVDVAVESAVERAVNRIKHLTFNHSIQPVVISEVKKVQEEIKQEVKEQYAEIKNDHRKLVKIAEKQAAYFDDSIVSDDKKNALKEAINDAKDEVINIESVVAEESPKVEEKMSVTPIEAVKTHAKVER